MANNQGKKTDQKMKPYLVYEYLMRHSDENNVAKTEDIIDYLRSCEISAERRSIYALRSESPKGRGFPRSLPSGREPGLSHLRTWSSKATARGRALMPCLTGRRGKSPEYASLRQDGAIPRPRHGCIMDLRRRPIPRVATSAPWSWLM